MPTLSTVESDDESMGDSMSDAFEVFEATSGGWHWRYVIDNGTVLASSAQDYASESEAVRGIRRIQSEASSTPVMYLKEPIDY